MSTQKPDNRDVAGERIDGLDLLRFVLAAAVVVYHYAYRMPHDGMAPGVEPAPRAFMFGRYAVDAFFIISGMVIARSAQRRSFADFAVSRIVRLQPALLACATITLAASLLLGTGREPTAGFGEWLASSLLLPLMISDHWMADWSYWSLTVELRFYLLAGLFFLFFRSSKAILIGCAVWLAVALVAMATAFGPLRELSLSSAAPCFIVGVMIHLHQSDPRWRTAAIMVGAAAVAAMPLQLMAESQHARVWQMVSWPEAVGIAVVVTGLAVGFNAIRSLGATSGLVRAMGAASYPLYLVHQFVGYLIIGRLMDAGWAFVPAMLAAGAVVTAIAFGVALCVEPVIVRRLKPALHGLVRGARRVRTQKVQAAGPTYPLMD